MMTIPFNCSSVTQERAQLHAANCLAIVKQKAEKEMPVYKSFMVVREMSGIKIYRYVKLRKPETNTIVNDKVISRAYMCC